MEGATARSFILWFILILGIGLLTLQILDARKLILSFDKINNYDNSYVEECLKYPLIAQSILLGIQFIICFFIVIFSVISFFPHSRFASSISVLNFKFLIYTIGPVMLGFCILGFVYWNSVMYSCTSINYKDKEANIFTIITTLIMFVISFVVTVSMGILEVVFLQVDSLLRKPEGSDLARKAFWYFASNSRSSNDNQIIRERYINNQNINNNNNNNQENSINVNVNNEPDHENGADYNRLNYL